MSAEHVSLGVKPHALTCIRMNAGDGVDEASAVVYDQVGVAVVSEGVVPLPSQERRVA